MADVDGSIKLQLKPEVDESAAQKSVQDVEMAMRRAIQSADSLKTILDKFNSNQVQVISQKDLGNAKMLSDTISGMRDVAMKTGNFDLFEELNTAYNRLMSSYVEASQKSDYMAEKAKQEKEARDELTKSVETQVEAEKKLNTEVATKKEPEKPIEEQKPAETTQQSATDMKVVGELSKQVKEALSEMSSIMSTIMESITKLTDSMVKFKASIQDARQSALALRDTMSTIDVDALKEAVNLQAKASAPTKERTPSARSLIADTQVVGMDTILDNTLTKFQKLGIAAKSIFGAITRPVANTVDAFKKIGSAISGATSKLNLFKKHSKLSVGDAAKNFKKFTLQTIKALIGVRGLYMGIRKLKSIAVNSFKEMAQQIPDFNAQISSLMTAFNQVKGSVGTMLQPLASTLIPLLNTLLGYLNDAMFAVGKFFAAFTGQKQVYKYTANQVDYAKSLDKTAKSAKEAQKALMGFDEINKLNDDSNKDATDDSANGMYEAVDVEDKFFVIAERIKSAFSGIVEWCMPIVESIQNMWNSLDFSVLIASFDLLWQQVEPILGNLNYGIAWLFDNLLTPLANWTVSDFLPQFLNTVSILIFGIKSAIEKLSPTLEYVWNDLIKPVASYIADVVSQVLDKLQNAIIYTVDLLEEKKDKLNRIFRAIGEILKVFGQAIKAVIDFILGAFEPLWKGMLKVAGYIIDALDDVLTFIKDVFNGEWDKLWKDLVNIAIDILNGLISVVETAINTIVGGLNKISFDVPDWVPGIGGKTFGFIIPTVDFKGIPRLAQGGVIPPNREFMAVLGDQKHGTNIEAPLETIKQAVAEELNEMIEAMMVGFNAVVESVDKKNFNVHIGDDDIGQANARYSSRQTIMRGV